MLTKGNYLKWLCLFGGVLVCLLSACAGSTTITSANPTAVPNSNVYLSVPNVDVSKPLMAGQQFIKIEVQNGDKVTKGLVASPKYGDFNVFPLAFNIPTLQPHENLDIELPVEVQAPQPTKNSWRMVYILSIPIVDPQTRKTIRVLTYNGSFEVAFTSTVDSSVGENLPDNPNVYNAESNKANLPESMYCLNAADDQHKPGTYPDGTKVTSGTTIDKHWYTSLCTKKSMIPDKLVGVPIWATFDYNGHNVVIQKKEDFSTNIEIPKGFTGNAILVFVYARQLSINGVDYEEPFGPSFWAYVISQ